MPVEPLVSRRVLEAFAEWLPAGCANIDGPTCVMLAATGRGQHRQDLVDRCTAGQMALKQLRKKSKKARRIAHPDPAFRRGGDQIMFEAALADMCNGELSRVGEKRQAACYVQIGPDAELLQCRLDAAPQSGIVIVNWSR